MTLHRVLPSASRTVRRGLHALLAAAAAWTTHATAESVFRDGFEPLEPPPAVTILRDDRVATLEMDYDGENAWGQWWTMDGSGHDAAGFLVSWWPAGTAAPLLPRPDAKHDGSLGCLDGAHAKASAATVRWLVTGNRRVQLQPLLNGSPYHVRVQRIDALGEIISLPRDLDFDGGDATRVDALRASMTHFDDFNLPLGPADETLWNNATVTSTDARFNLFFVNDQYHAHTLHGTRVDNTGDRSQTSQRFRKPVRIENGVRRRIVFDMDGPLSPRSVWYLDLNPVRTDLTAHIDFFDMDGTTGLPAGTLRLRSQFQTFSVNIIGMDGASHQVASVDMEDAGRQAVSNVRRSFEARVGTDGIEVLIDGRSVIDASYAPYALAPGDYEPLWIAFGYNTPKDAVPYYLVHWDNFGFDGPDVDPREVHNYVTRIEGTDYRKANRGNGDFPSFTVKIPDDLRPTVAGATAQATLVLTYQMGDFSNFTLVPGDHVTLNGSATYALPQRDNNSVPSDPGLLTWGIPYTVQVPLGTLVHGGASPLVVGDNTFQFFAENTGILDVHVEVAYPPGSAPAYTPPAAIHHFPLHSELPRLGLPARFEQIGDTQVGDSHRLTADPPARIAVSGVVPLNLVVGNHSYANWAPELMVFPVQSTEVWSTGGTTGIATIEVFLRPSGGDAGTSTRVLALDTGRDVPAPQGRYLRSFDSRAFADGDYELFVQATSPSGLKSHPSYGDETYLWDAAQLSGAYYPIQVHIQN
ncbi:hypothetical protein FHW12_000813 [Dokdonella fugitiva]|uniref:Uncharacterized protein n=1 Tax=Dokdonella fugitiva TaxID=328517 RepID=A0A839EY26_9GAMM|nr:hypothetical protein [Dokdonella fugitiva]MBA8886622.1 hypothetical protein [Dokdonella fugitiva]